MKPSRANLILIILSGLLLLSALPVALAKDSPPASDNFRYQLLVPLPQGGGETASTTTGIADLIVIFYRFGWAIAGVLAMGMIIYGGFQWFSSGGNAGRIGEAKERITNSVLGLLLLMISFVALRAINPAFLFLQEPVLDIDIDVSGQPTKVGDKRRVKPIDCNTIATCEDYNKTSKGQNVLDPTSFCRSDPCQIAPSGGCFLRPGLLALKCVSPPSSQGQNAEARIASFITPPTAVPKGTPVSLGFVLDNITDENALQYRLRLCATNSQQTNACQNIPPVPGGGTVRRVIEEKTDFTLELEKKQEDGSFKVIDTAEATVDIQSPKNNPPAPPPPTKISSFEGPPTAVKAGQPFSIGYAVANPTKDTRVRFCAVTTKQCRVVGTGKAQSGGMIRNITINQTTQFFLLVEQASSSAASGFELVDQASLTVTVQQ